ncbi:hypothetical protein ES703_99550 [subsurface metagenome]
MHREKIFVDAVPKSGYLWCLHCERAYEYGKYRLKGWFQMCPYSGCDGDTVLDAWQWECLREIHPEYPVVPEMEVVYKLYT